MSALHYAVHPPARFPLRVLVRLLLSATAVSATCASTLAAAAPPAQFSVTGAVHQTQTVDLAALSALPAITQTDSYTAAGKPQTHTYTGASLWNVLGSAGIVIDSHVKNDVLGGYVLATGADGYKTVFSLGELDPAFGNRPDLAAYAETIDGVSAPLTADGFARVTAPGDVKGGRYVSNLIDLDVRRAASTAPSQGGGVSTHFTVSGAVQTPTGFDLAALQALPQVTETVGAHTYTGVSFWSLLNAGVGIDLNPKVKNDVLGKYVVATGTDGYRSVFSLGELDSAFGNQPDLIAYAVDGVALGSSGFARIVVPNDVKAGRWVSNLDSLEVLSAAPVPEPATAALVLAGLAAIAAKRSTSKRPRAGAVE